MPKIRRKPVRKILTHEDIVDMTQALVHAESARQKLERDTLECDAAMGTLKDSLDTLLEKIKELSEKTHAADYQ